MAKHDFYDPIDLHQKELLNVRLQALLNLPPDPLEGQICYHSISSKKLGAIYDGTEWRYFGLPPLGKSYDSQALMLVDQANQIEGYAYFDGTKEWRKLATSTGVIADYREIGGEDENAVHYNVSDGKNAIERQQARDNIGSTSATPQLILTAGAINDLVVNSNHLVFTGADVVLSGIVAGLNGEEITILNVSGTNLTLLLQSVLSEVSNRFNASVVVPNLSVLRIKYRTTTNRWFLENVGVNDGRYLRKDIEDTKTGNVTFIPAPTISGFFRILSKDGVNNSYLYGGTNAGRGSHVWDGRLDDSPYLFRIDGVSSLSTFRAVQGDVGLGGGNRPVWNFLNRVQFSGVGHILFSGSVASAYILLYDLGGIESYRLKQNGAVFHIRSTIATESIRRDEQRLFYLSTITTAGAINDQALTAGIFNYRFTAATSITGFTLGEIGMSIIIQNNTGATLTLDHESASSIPENRIKIIGASNLVIPIDGKATLIYCTENRWELLSKNF